MYQRVNGNANGSIGQNGMNIHVNPYDQSYLYSSTTGMNIGHISMSPYSTTTGTTGGHPGHIYSSGTTLNRQHITSSSNGHSISNSVNGSSNGNLALHQLPSSTLLHSASAVTSSPAVGAAVTAAASGSSLGPPMSNAFHQTSPPVTTQLTRTNSSSHGLTNVHHNQQSGQGGVAYNQAISNGSLGANGNSGSNNSTHQMLPSGLDPSSPSDPPQKKTFYVLIILIAIGIIVMVITVVTAIVIFFKCKLPLVKRKFS